MAYLQLSARSKTQNCSLERILETLGSGRIEVEYETRSFDRNLPMPSRYEVWEWRGHILSQDYNINFGASDVKHTRGNVFVDVALDADIGTSRWLKCHPAQPHRAAHNRHC